jgi:hypothetical protein
MARRDLCLDIIEADPFLHQNDDFPMGDTQLWAEIATRARLHFIPESLATHNIIEGSATRNRNAAKALRFSMAGARLQMYLCDKYDLPSQVKEKYRDYLRTCSLRLALHTRDQRLADELRSSAERGFSAVEWCRYFGAKYGAIHYLYRFGSAVIALFRVKHSQWA